jgi:hypothetical protein
MPRTLTALKPAAGLLGAAALLYAWHPESVMARGLGGAAALLLLLWLVQPAAAERLQQALQQLFLGVAAVIGLVSMALAYFAVLTPVALLLRLGGRDLLRHKLDTGASQWQAPERRSYDDDFFKAQF